MSYGDAKRVWSMDKISNNRITQTEYDKWIRIMRDCKLHIMTSSVYILLLIIILLGSKRESQIN